jgi:S-adenosylmethionine/arginine decarboxylase-like enzyme
MEDNRFAVGTRVRLTRAVDRYPHFIAPEGATGTVVVSERGNIVAVRLDTHLPGAEDWSNEIHWSDDDLAAEPDPGYSHISYDLEVVS